MAIEIRQTKRASLVYRVIVATGGPGSKTVTKTFRSRAAAEAWEREMLDAANPAPDSGDPARQPPG
jgi:hypothetical protein